MKSFIFLSALFISTSVIGGELSFLNGNESVAGVKSCDWCEASVQCESENGPYYACETSCSQCCGPGGCNEIYCRTEWPCN